MIIAVFVSLLLMMVCCCFVMLSCVVDANVGVVVVVVEALGYVLF